MRLQPSMIGLFLLAACTTMVAMPEADEGHRLFQNNCASCHGEAAKGAGPLAANLDPSPPDLTGLAARNNGVVSRIDVLSTIDGFHRRNFDGPGMPEFGAFLTGNLVPVDAGDGVLTPTPRPLAALLVYLESIQE